MKITKNKHTNTTTKELFIRNYDVITLKIKKKERNKEIKFLKVNDLY